MRINKSARLVILLHLDDHGWLDDASCQTIANWFDQPGLNRSTILRDIRELPALRDEIKRISSRTVIWRRRWKK